MRIAQACLAVNGLLGLAEITAGQIAVGAALLLAAALLVLFGSMIRRGTREAGSKSPEARNGAPAITRDSTAEGSRGKDALGSLRQAMDKRHSGDVSTSRELFDGAVRAVTDVGGVSVLVLQKRLGVDFGQATILIERMERAGYVSPPAGNKPRKVLPEAFRYVEEIDGGSLPIM